MAIASMDQLVSALASADQDVPLYWQSGSTAVAAYSNLSRLSAGSAHGTPAIPPLNSAGGHVPTALPPGYPTITAPPAGKVLYLARLALNSSVAGNISLYDRVYAASGFSGVVTTPQTITGFPTLPAGRVTSGGDGLEIWLESYTAIGATTSSVTVSYTNHLGVAGRVTPSDTTIASFPASRLQRLRLQDGDTGVRSIESITLGASTGTAGNFGILLLDRIAQIPLPTANVGQVMDFASLALPTLDANTALMFVHMATTTTTGSIMGSFNIVAG